MKDERKDEAEAWDRLVAALREDIPGPAPVWLEAAVMAEVRAAAQPSAAKRAAAWLTRPSLRLSPLGAGLAAAAVVAALILIGRPAAPAAVQMQTAAPAEPVVYVQFVLEAPQARTVALAGDFNGWDGSYDLAHVDGDGTWTGRIPLQPGVHQYMFVVNGSEWVTDPDAERFSDDGFGNRNAVVAVSPPGAV